MEIHSVKLGELCDISGGVGFPHEYQGRKSEKYPFYKVSDMNTPGNEVVMKKHNHAISEADVQKLRARVLPSGTVIFPKIGAAIATNKKRILTVPALVDNNVMALIPSQDIDSKYLFYFMLSFDLHSWANKASLPSIRKTDVEVTEVPIPFSNGKPDLAEQKRIADELDGVFADTERALTLMRTNENHLANLRQSVLREFLRADERERE